MRFEKNLARISKISSGNETENEQEARPITDAIALEEPANKKIELAVREEKKSAQEETGDEALPEPAADLAFSEADSFAPAPPPVAKAHSAEFPGR